MIEEKTNVNYCRLWKQTEQGLHFCVALFLVNNYRTSYWIQISLLGCIGRVHFAIQKCFVFPYLETLCDNLSSLCFNVYKLPFGDLQIVKNNSDKCYI